MSKGKVLLTSVVAVAIIVIAVLCLGREILREQKEKTQKSAAKVAKQSVEKAAYVQEVKSSLSVAESNEAKPGDRLAALKVISEALQKEHPYSQEAGGGSFKVFSDSIGKEQGQPWIGELRRKVESLQDTPKLYNQLAEIEKKAKISKKDAEEAKKLRNKIHSNLYNLKDNRLGMITYTNSDNLLARIENRLK